MGSPRSLIRRSVLLVGANSRGREQNVSGRTNLGYSNSDCGGGANLRPR